MKAVPASAVGSFHERPVAPFLRDVFACTWIHQMPGTEAPPVIVMPDGTIDLQWINGAFRIAGPDKDPQTEIVSPGTVVIGFRFHPATASSWLGVPAIEIVGQRLALDTVWGSKARRLAEGVHHRSDITMLVGSLEALIARCAPAHPTIDACMHTAYRLIEAGPPPDAPLVPWLGRALGMSERTLRRRFDESFGYGPKTLDRILRYQRFRRLARASKDTTALLAVEAGYSDQAHLVRESRRLTGSTPRRLAQAIASDGDRWAS